MCWWQPGMPCLCTIDCSSEYDNHHEGDCDHCRIHNQGHNSNHYRNSSDYSSDYHEAISDNDCLAEYARND